MFNPSHSLRTISSTFRRGPPPAHWSELALAEAAHRARVYRNYQELTSPPWPIHSRLCIFIWNETDLTVFRRNDAEDSGNDPKWIQMAV